MNEMHDGGIIDSLLGLVEMCERLHDPALAERNRQRREQEMDAKFMPAWKLDREVTSDTNRTELDTVCGRQFDGGPTT
jgi:hypothetical protein